MMMLSFQLFKVCRNCFGRLNVARLEVVMFSAFLIYDFVILHVIFLQNKTAMFVSYRFTNHDWRFV